MKRSCFLLILVLSTTIYAQAQSGSVYDQLAAVNAEWKHQPDVDKQLRSTPAKMLSEQQLIQLHLTETEKLLRGRDISGLSPELKANRLRNLDVLHKYLTAGVFPLNTKFTYRLPIFIDEKNTYCAVGFLMSKSGGDKMAREIHQTQNYSILRDIKHPMLMNWAQHSGLTVDELALIQPAYGDCPSVIAEFHYNNTGTDVNEYIEIHQSPGSTITKPLFKTVLFYDAGNTLYKTLTLAQMQSYTSNGGDKVYYYTFPANEDFADAGKVEIRGDGMISVNQLISVITYTNASVQVDNYYSTPSTPNVVTRVFSIGESESTVAGTSLTYCGHCDTWTLQSLAATPGTQNPCTILPIGLSSFSSTINKNKVLLLWETASEMNNKRFVVQRSFDGVTFEDIGSVNGSGNSSVLRQYAYTDNTPNTINYYRLRQEDIDGRYSYSKILSAKIDKASPLYISETVVSNDLRYEVNSSFNGSKIQIYDLVGRCVYTTSAKAGVQHLNTSGLTAGQYIIRLITTNGEAYTEKFIRQ